MQWNDVMLTNEKKNNILNLKVSKKIFLILLIYINFCTCTIPREAQCFLSHNLGK